MTTTRPATTDAALVQQIGESAIAADRAERELREAESRALPAGGRDGVRQLRARRDAARAALTAAIAAAAGE